MTRPMIIENPKSFYDEIQISDKCTFSEGSNKNYVQELRSVYCQIIRIFDNLPPVQPRGCWIQGILLYLNSAMFSKIY
jgi:hypothetical protein